jgi:hypothetical protein
MFPCLTTGSYKSSSSPNLPGSFQSKHQAPNSSLNNQNFRSLSHSLQQPRHHPSLKSTNPCPASALASRLRPPIRAPRRALFRPRRHRTLRLLQYPPQWRSSPTPRPPLPPSPEDSAAVCRPSSP